MHNITLLLCFTFSSVAVITSVETKQKNSACRFWKNNHHAEMITSEKSCRTMKSDRKLGLWASRIRAGYNTPCRCCCWPGNFPSRRLPSTPLLATNTAGWPLHPAGIHMKCVYEYQWTSFTFLSELSVRKNYVAKENGSLGMHCRRKFTFFKKNKYSLTIKLILLKESRTASSLTYIISIIYRVQWLFKV